MISKKDLCFYRVDNFKGFSPFLVPSVWTLRELIEKVKKDGNYSQFQIFIDSQLIESALTNIKLDEIVKKKYHSQNPSPTFYILQLHQSEQSSSCLEAEYQAELAQLLKLQGDTRTEWIGANGHTLYDGRSKALLASSFKQSSGLHRSNSTYLPHMQECMREQPTLLKGKLSSQINQIKQMISRLQKDVPVSTASKQYSNFDLNFVTSLEKTYLKYMLLSGGKLSYVEYNEMSFGVIQRRIGPDDRVGIIGDYGTGLPDSYELLQNMVLGEGVNIILHLGDVYYAGTPQEYQQNITSFLRALRKRAKRDVYFYSIPGNHDYYSWGAPFLCFVKEINEEQPSKQRASYFCLRTWDDKWQFLGADSAYHDSNPLDQLNQASLGPRLRTKELAWHKQKLQHFPGSTIFLSHHQLFSTRDRLCGSLSKYRAFSCINPVLHKQLFEYLPFISAWFWGHEHAFMLFQEGFWGLPKCRLLGNSSFHVLQRQQHPYARHKGFPVIPFIQQDEPYMKKYLPLSPSSNEKQPYFHLTFAVIDGKQANDNIRIKYYCSPSYSDASKKATHFKYYQLHEQTMMSKINLISSSKAVITDQQILLKHQIGLTISSIKSELQLNLHGSLFQFRHFPADNHQQVVFEQIPYLIHSSQGYISSNPQGKLQFTSIPSQRSKWTLRKHRVFSDQSKQIRFIDTFSIRHLQSLKFLGLTLSFGQARPVLTTKPQSWCCLPPSANTSMP